MDGLPRVSRRGRTSHGSDRRSGVATAYAQPRHAGGTSLDARFETSERRRERRSSSVTLGLLDDSVARAPARAPLRPARRRRVPPRSMRAGSQRCHAGRGHEDWSTRALRLTAGAWLEPGTARRLGLAGAAAEDEAAEREAEPERAEREGADRDRPSATSTSAASGRSRRAPPRSAPPRAAACASRRRPAGRGRGRRRSRGRRTSIECIASFGGARTPADTRPVVAAFDVDGTLTTRDCVTPFLCRAAGPAPRSRARAPSVALARRARARATATR